MSQPILLVEDSDDDELLFKRTLKKAKLTTRVQRVVNVDEAIEYLSGRGVFADRGQFPYPRVIFIDLKLPGRSGFELLQWIKEQAERRPVFLVVLAGVGRAMDIAHAYDMGANSFLTKPIKPEDVENLVKAHPDLWND